MSSRSQSRDRDRRGNPNWSPPPRSPYERSRSRQGRRHSLSRSPGHRSPSPRQNGRHHDASRSVSSRRSLSRSWSRGRSRSRYRGQGRKLSKSWSRDRYSRVNTRSLSPASRGTKIVVERLTKNVNEEHLKEIFGQFGHIKDLDLPLSRQFNTNRGTAYILYYHEADAETATAHMHEAQLDGATVNVSIVLPRNKFSQTPPMARRGANFDPRNPPPNHGRSGPSRHRGRYGHRPDTYRPRSLSRSRSPPPPPRSRGKYRSRSNSYSSHSPNRRRRYRHGGSGRRQDAQDDRGRSPSRYSYDSYDRRTPSRTREW